MQSLISIRIKLNIIYNICYFFFYNVTFFIFLQDRKNIEIIKQNNL